MKTYTFNVNTKSGLKEIKIQASTFAEARTLLAQHPDLQ